MCCGSLGGFSISQIGLLSNRFSCSTRRICEIEIPSLALNFKNDKMRYTQSAIQSCVSTALSDVPKKLFTFRFCLIHLKKSSICHRSLYKAAISVAFNDIELVRN